MNVELPNGVIVTDIPDNATDWEIQQDAIRQGVAKAEDFPPVDFDAEKMVREIPGSALQLMKDMSFPIRHPIQTVKGMTSIVRGGADKLQSEQGDLPTQNEQAFDAMLDFYGDRFGSVDALKNTAMNDPVGILSDISGIVTLGTSSLPKITGRAGKVVETLNKTAKAVDPMNLAANAVRLPLGKLIPKDLPVKQMNSAVKWNTTTPMKIRNSLAQSMLEEGIQPTLPGMRKAWKVIDDMQEGLTKLIEESTNSGVTIPREKVFKYIRDAKKKAAEGGNPANELKQIDKFVDDLETTWFEYDLPDFTPTKIQRFKQDLYELVGDDKWARTTARGTDAARMATARSARQIIEDLVPEARAMNRREGKMIALTDALEQKAARIENTNNIPLGAPINVGAGTYLGNLLGMPEAGAAAGVGLSLMDLPKNKARLAQRMYNLQNSGLLDAPIPGQMIRQGAIQSGRIIPEL